MKKLTPDDIINAQATNAIAEEMVQALYDRLGLVHSIVVTIAMMAILLHTRAKLVGGERAFANEVKRVAEALANAPEDFSTMLNVHGHPDSDATKKPN